MALSITNTCKFMTTKWDEARDLFESLRDELIMLLGANAANSTVDAALDELQYHEGQADAVERLGAWAFDPEGV